MSQPIIEINGLSKRYRLGEIGFSSFRDEAERLLARLSGRAPAPEDVEKRAARDFWALRDVSFSIQPGEVVGIIGRNGAGKSTLLKLLSRITEPTTGEIVLRGRVASLLEVGTGFHPELSGRDNIFLNGAILGMKRAEIAAKFDEIVAFAEVEKFIDTPVKRYSSGMYVKLAFAVAAHLEPDILIVDEVLAVGDAAFQRKCIKRMRELAGQGGRTILFVSHQIDAVLRLCSRAVLLRDGRVAADGVPAEVIRDYYDSTDSTVLPRKKIDLSPYPRNGDKRARFIGFHYELLSSDAPHPYPGCSLRFHVEIWSERRQNVGGVALILETETGVKLLNFDLQRILAPIPLCEGRQVFQIEAHRLPINAMALRMSLWMVDVSKTELIDEILHFGRLDLIERDGEQHASSKVRDSLLLLPDATLALNPSP